MDKSVKTLNPEPDTADAPKVEEGVEVNRIYPIAVEGVVPVVVE